MGPGDISDEFDDEALRTSIEQADQKGQWRDQAGAFVDPKLETIKKQLTERERADYAERRRRELQQAASDGATAAAADALVAAASDAADPFASDWRENVVPGAERQEPSPLATVTEPSYVVSDQSVHPVLSQVRPLFDGLWVFVPIAVVQFVLLGWSADLPLRTLAAAMLSGWLWRTLEAERFRAAAIGIGVHALAFFATSMAWTTYALIANAVGFVIALIGSLVVGSLRESRNLLADRTR